MLKRVLIVYGPTAIGKTSLSLKLAKKFNGELISADSRQIYRGMDVGTGKDLKILGKEKIWLLDIVSPDQNFSSFNWAKLAKKAIVGIWRRKKLPIIVGGSAFYIKTLLDGFGAQGVPANWQLRKKLEHWSLKKLQVKLEGTWPERWQSLNNSDRNNPRRLARGIEIGLMRTGKKVGQKQKKFLKDVSIFGIYLTASLKFIQERIANRIKKRIKEGLIEEIKTLLKEGCSWSDPGMNCLGYKEFHLFFKRKENLAQACRKWLKDEKGFARRQLLWFTQDKRFLKINVEDRNWISLVNKRLKRWYDGKQ